MEVSITNATGKEIKDFDEKAWHGEDIEHYGRPVEWVEKKFVFKATKSGKIVGTIKGKFEAGVVYISALIVAKSKRRQGIGRKLIERVEKFGKQLRAHKVFLFTMEEWKSSQFYKNLGYKKTGDLPKHYLEKDFVIYSKFI